MVTNSLLFHYQLKRFGITPWNGYNVMNYSIAEEEISIIGPEFLKRSSMVLGII